jgi:hypothetical protein
MAGFMGDAYLKDAAAISQAELHHVAPHFRGNRFCGWQPAQVLFLDLRKDGGLDRLLQLAAATRSHFAGRGLLQQAQQAFVPHITVAKTSKLQGWAGKRGGRGGGRDWRQERRAKQQRLDRQQAPEEAALEAGRSDEQVAAEAADGNPAEVAAIEEATEAAISTAAEGLSPLRAAAPQPVPAAAAYSSIGGGGSSGSAAAQPQAHDRPAVPSEHERQQQSNWRLIPAEAWAPHIAIVGGRAVLAEIQLCAMQGRKGGQYYPVLCSLPLGGASSDGGASCAAEQPARSTEAQPAGAHADTSTALPSSSL